MKLYLFDTHTHNFKSQFLGIKQLELDNEIRDSYFSFGIHPKDTLLFSSQKKELLTQTLEICSNNKCLAIGEIGIDNRYKNKELQEEIFIEQLKIAQKLNKPVILHSVNSIDRILALQKKYARNSELIYHGFNKTSALERLLDNKFLHFSIGESIFSNSSLQEAIKTIPNSRLFIETDTSKIELNIIYEEVAKIKSIPLQTFTEEIYKNVNRVFKL